MKTPKRSLLSWLLLALLLFTLMAVFSTRSIGVELDNMGHILVLKNGTLGSNIMEIISTSGTVALGLFTLGLTLFFLWKKDWWHLGLYYFVVAGGVVFNFILKRIVTRPRPQDAEHYYNIKGLQIESYSFPSGHTMRTMVLFLFLIYWTQYYLKNQSQKKWIIFICIIYMALVGISRIALHAHYLTDVLGALFASLLWFFISLFLFRWIYIKYGPATND